jgi:hypothetical protein
MWFLAVALSAPAYPGERPEPQGAKRPATVADAIQMTRWADRGYFLGGPARHVGLFSPDGKHLLVVVKKGNLNYNTNEYSLLLFPAKNAFDQPHPRVLVRMSSSSNRDAVADVRWLDDNESVIFLGENPGENPQIFRFNIRTNQLQRLTNHPTPIVVYDVSENGAEIIYKADPPVRKMLATEETRRNGIVITTQYPSDLLLGDCANLPMIRANYKELFVQRPGRPALRIPTQDFVEEYLPLSLSPDGHYAALAVYLAEVPKSWSEYQDRLLRPYITARLRPGIPSNVIQYMLVDTQTRRVSPLLDAPMSWYRMGSAWDKDSHSIVLSGIYLPLSVTGAAERELRKEHTFVAEVRIPSKQITKVTDKELQVVRWDHRTQMLVLAPESSGEPEHVDVYKKTDSEWSPLPGAPQDVRSQYPLDVTLEEDMNTPPRIFVTDKRIQRKSALLDLNPQFRDIQFAKEEIINWNAADGHGMTGGLYLPPNLARGMRYPLVIQTHGFDKNRFWIDGPYSSAFAAQPLAAWGFVVLQIGRSTDPEEDRRFVNTPGEAPRQMAAYEGAIDYLDSRGLIDRNRVGLIGFSRTVLHAGYTLTHSKYKFAAATLADGFDGGYMNSLLWRDPADYSLVNGGPPQGPTMSAWLRNSPGFNLDKVTAAVRLEYHGSLGVLGGWQWFSGLLNLDKPVDFIWLPFGTHLLVKPWERYTSLQGNVDWFCFWLKGEEDPDPAKAEQYARWRDLRRLQDEGVKQRETAPAN